MDLRLIITAESPLSLSERKPGGVFQESLRYVPGSALRGSLATRLLNGPCAAHKNHHFDPHCDFCQIFLGPQAAVFTHAYPVHDPNEEVQVLPATAVSCKRQSGFRPTGHSVFDTLVERLCCEVLQPAGLVYNPLCPVCQNRVEAFTGFYICHSHDDHLVHYHKRDVDQRLLTRAAINRRRMVAEEGLLFSPYVVSEVVEKDRHGSCEERGYQPTTFVGYVWGLPDNFDPTWLTRVTAVGGRSARGLGHVKVKSEEVEGSSRRPSAIQGRTATLDAEIERTWEHVQRLGGNSMAKEGLYFTLTLRSDAVLRTTDGLPTMVLDADMLACATGIQARLVRSYASYHYGGGWQNAWGLPKPAQVLTRAGSVYVFQADKLTDADYTALAELEVQGLGDLTSEGYGQVRVSDAFHLKRRGPNE